MRLRLFLVATFALAASFSMAESQCTKLYMYGFAASFNDSTVYLTDIQEVDSAWTDVKTGFLYSRDNYSYQLRDYLKKTGVPHPTCITVYAKTRKEAEKKYVAMKRRYTTKGNYIVKYIESTDFGFYPIIPNEDEMKTEPRAKEKKERPQMPMGKGSKRDGMNGPRPNF